ncbi:Mu transposase C-terminal domain-containing protein [Metabacillus fastidiosus]|uniref:Mu transposase C-terminal domain-containing protein n=1 Tax=Metabacillus fastidiosus TaxID=1458 RepID=UPI002DBDF004|nr:Mu transposase C-terminal domain-containing protein [Metabacillus fastidiosus]MEC2074818.1 DDE-type integrase/transposase/recombinase [Metabacillus fastidiosus]
MFAKNEIIKFADASGEIMIERILWIDEGYVICYTINIIDETTLPIKRKLSDLEELSREGNLEFIEELFPYIYMSEEQIPIKSRNLRDKRWEIVRELCELEPEIFIREKRGNIVKQLVEKTGKNKTLIYDYLRQYWQQGKVKNSLLPQYRNSGGVGKEKKSGTKKRGRPRKFIDTLGEGINVDDDIKQVFRLSIKKYYHTSKKNPLKTAYKMMISNYFVDEYRYEDGVKKPILKDGNKVPTFEQFEYWYKKMYKREETKRQRLGDRKYESEHRAVLGTSVGEMYGPGTKYQIDATVGDVYLVSSYNRNWIIGRPVIYVVIDVFSRMVTGLYVGLEGPSWLGASMALANAASDKVAYCRKHGIEIDQEQWNTDYLPETLIADRGELEGYNVERLISAFNMKVENTPPYRADWKGIVEQHFRTINLKVKPFLPGVVDTDVRIRGDRDYRLDAKLTLKEFTSIIIKCVLYHNNHHMLRNYDADEMMLKDELKLIPKVLWDWGMKNRSGSLRKFSENIVKLNLMPEANASVTYKGIEFKGMRYSCKKALREDWFSQARDKSWRIKVAYDPRNMEHIYIPVSDGIGYEVCELLEHQYQKYAHHSLCDVEYLHAYEEYSIQAYQHEQLQKETDLQSEIKHIVDIAVKRAKEEKIPMSNRQRTSSIRENRAIEKEVNRKEEAFLLVSQEELSSTESSIIPISSDEPVVESANKLDLLRQKQKELKELAKRNQSSL